MKLPSQLRSDSNLEPPTYAKNRAKSPTVNDPDRIISAATISIAPVASMRVEPFIDATADSNALSLVAARRLPSLRMSKWLTARLSAPAIWTACTAPRSSPSRPVTRLVASRLARR